MGLPNGGVAPPVIQPTPQPSPSTPMMKLDIGTWGAHCDSVGIEILRGQNASSDAAATIIKSLNASPPNFFSMCDRDFLGESARKVLMNLADSQHTPGEEDLKIDLSLGELADLIGQDIVDSLVAWYAGPCDEVKIRRGEA